MDLNIEWYLPKPNRGGGNHFNLLTDLSKINLSDWTDVLCVLELRFQPSKDSDFKPDTACSRLQYLPAVISCCHLKDCSLNLNFLMLSCVWNLLMNFDKVILQFRGNPLGNNSSSIWAPTDGGGWDRCFTGRDTVREQLELSVLWFTAMATVGSINHLFSSLHASNLIFFC